ncbi:hypothetical protein [Streptomyces sp. NPDC003717]|uniref:hypothetical protein n=1 Tax=Streptomyces sp. NPDC003717 TaxID=3154276 RepID=UPI0033AC3D2B
MKTSQNTRAACRRLGAIMLAVCLGLWAGVAAAPAASAVGGPVLVCTGSVSQSYSPGLLLVPRQTTYHGTVSYSTCPVNDGAVTSGLYAESLTYTASCTANGGPSEADVAWNNGQHSHLAVTGVEADVAGNVQIFTSIGQVTSGRYVGHVVNIVTVLPNLATLAACLLPPGLTHNQGTATLTVAGL